MAERSPYTAWAQVSIRRQALAAVVCTQRWLTLPCGAHQISITWSLTHTARAQVSISGQALVFVVRTQYWSLADRAGTAIYVAFGCAQVCSTALLPATPAAWQIPVQLWPHLHVLRLRGAAVCMLKSQPLHTLDDEPLHGA